jgi:hypothetical protein
VPLRQPGGPRTPSLESPLLPLDGRLPLRRPVGATRAAWHGRCSPGRRAHAVAALSVIEVQGLRAQLQSRSAAVRTRPRDRSDGRWSWRLRSRSAGVRPATLPHKRRWPAPAYASNYGPLPCVYCCISDLAARACALRPNTTVKRGTVPGCFNPAAPSCAAATCPEQRRCRGSLHASIPLRGRMPLDHRGACNALLIEEGVNPLRRRVPCDPWRHPLLRRFPVSIPLRARVPLHQRWRSRRASRVSVFLPTVPHEGRATRLVPFLHLAGPGRLGSDEAGRVCRCWWAGKSWARQW